MAPSGTLQVVVPVAMTLVGVPCQLRPFHQEPEVVFFTVTLTRVTV